MRYTTVLGLGSVVAAIVALANPSASHLALRALLVLMIVTLGGHLVIEAVQELPESPFHAGSDEHRLDAAIIPRDLAALGEELRESRFVVPESVTIRLARQLGLILRVRHGLSADDPADREAVESLLSPAALTLLESYGVARVLRRDLDALLSEMEHL